MTGEPTCRWLSDGEAIANLRSDIKEINDLCLATIGEIDLEALDKIATEPNPEWLSDTGFSDYENV